MIRLFSINDPLRLIYAFIVLVIGCIPLISIGSDQLLDVELIRMLLGEKMSEGSLIYKSIDDFTAPFSALVYSIIHSLFGRSHAAYVIISMIFVFFQVIIFSLWLNKLSILPEKGYVPALAYCVVSLSCYEFYALSPQLMGMTFVLLAIFQLFFIVKFGSENEYELSSGIYLGIAALFYLPYLLFALLALFIIAAYSSMRIQKGIVFIFGIFLPMLLVGLFFYWKQSLAYYLVDLLFYSLSVFKHHMIDNVLLLQTFALLVLFSIIAIFKTLASRSFVNYQQKVQVTFILWLFIAFLIGLITPRFLFSIFYVVVPALAFFIANWWLLIKKNRFKDASLVLLLLSIGTGYYMHYKSLPVLKEVPTYGNILVLGDDLSVYQNPKNSPATRFINWRMAKKYFLRTDEQEHLEHIYDAFEQERPDVIFDPNNLLGPVLEKIPPLKRNYLLTEKGYYIEKPL